MLNVSREGQAGTSPRVLIRPRLGLSPKMPFMKAGTRPLPAVSVPKLTGTRFRAAATAEPELDPPGM